MDKMMYLAELRQLAAVTRNFEDYTRVMKRVERVCDSIEHDIGLSQPCIEVAAISMPQMRIYPAVEENPGA